MSAAESHALDAVALQLVSALDRYGQDTAALIAHWPDLERYRGVSDQVETIRMYSSALPPVQVQWVELLIAHAELVHVLWRGQYGGEPGAGEQLAAVRDRHADCLAALRARCVRVLGGEIPSGGDAPAVSPAPASARSGPAGS